MQRVERKMYVKQLSARSVVEEYARIHEVCARYNQLFSKSDLRLEVVSLACGADETENGELVVYDVLDDGAQFVVVDIEVYVLGDVSRVASNIFAGLYLEPQAGEVRLKVFQQRFIMDHEDFKGMLNSKLLEQIPEELTEELRRIHIPP